MFGSYDRRSECAVASSSKRGRHCGHIRGRVLPPWSLGPSRGARCRSRRCRRSRISGDRQTFAQPRRTQEDAATRPQAWQRKPTAEAVLRRVRQGLLTRPLEICQPALRCFCRVLQAPWSSESHPRQIRTGSAFGCTMLAGFGPRLR